MSKPTIYVAAPWKDKEYAKQVAKQFEAAGFEVTSRWINFHEDKPADQSGLSYSLDVLQNEGMQDIDDVYRADFFCLLNTQKRGEETSGKAVETGLAIAKGKIVVMVGEPSNIFHTLDCVMKVKTVREAIEYCLTEGMLEKHVMEGV